MAIVILNKKAFEKKVGKITEKLKDRISMLGCPIEAETPEEIQIDVSPNRPDLLSEQGFARALSSFIGVKTGLREYDVRESDEFVIIDPSVLDVRPSTVCAIVKNLSFTDEKIKEIIQIQEKLHITYGRNRKKVAIGIYPLEKIKFPITYFAADPDTVTFKPLELTNEMTGREVLEHHPAGKEYGHLLKGDNLFNSFNSVQWAYTNDNLGVRHLKIFSNDNHIVEGVCNAIWGSKSIHLNLQIYSIKV